jgi:hypothetical protein
MRPGRAQAAERLPPAATVLAGKPKFTHPSNRLSCLSAFATVDLRSPDPATQGDFVPIIPEAGIRRAAGKDQYRRRHFPAVRR